MSGQQQTNSVEQDASGRPQPDSSRGDDTRAKQAKAGHVGTRAAAARDLAADSQRSSHDNRRRPTPKGGHPSTPAKSEDDFQV